MMKKRIVDDGLDGPETKLIFEKYNGFPQMKVLSQERKGAGASATKGH